MQPKYKNAPTCPKCYKEMVYLYTDVKRWKSVWICRDCDIKSTTIGYPDDEEPIKK